MEGSALWAGGSLWSACRLIGGRHTGDGGTRGFPVFCFVRDGEARGFLVFCFVRDGEARGFLVFCFVCPMTVNSPLKAHYMQG